MDEIGHMLIWNINKPHSPPIISLRAHDECINKVVPFACCTCMHCCVTCSDDKSLKVWDVDLYRCVRTFLGHTSFVTGCDIAQSAKIIGMHRLIVTVGLPPILASCSIDSTVRLWHTSTEHHVFLLRMPRPASSVCFVQGQCNLLLTAGPSMLLYLFTF